MEAKRWADEQLRVMVLQSVALYAHDEIDKAVQLLGEALALAEPGGFIRTFVDEGEPIKQLLLEALRHRGIMPDYIGRLLAAFEAENKKNKTQPVLPRCPAPYRTIKPTRNWKYFSLSPRVSRIVRSASGFTWP